MIKEILKKAIIENVSDVILSPNKQVCYKIDGEIKYIDDFGIITNEIMNSFFLQIVKKTQQDIFNKTKELDFSLGLGKVRFRVNIFGVKDGFGFVFRVIASEIPDFNTLGLPLNIINFTKKRNGLILVTGPVGSGKTTTLASLINDININYDKHIITIEDPIEYIYNSKKSLVEQREVGVDTLSFDNGLKYALRQASDVIMIGEMRDLETFRLALRAAETGNLVFATLHTSGAARTIARIIDMFPAGEKDQIRSQLAESLIGVVWQKLLKNNNGKGRVVACEVLKNNIGISNIIRKGETHKINSIIETSKGEGMIGMKDTLKELFEKKAISEEVYKNELSYL